MDLESHQASHVVDRIEECVDQGGSNERDEEESAEKSVEEYDDGRNNAGAAVAYELACYTGGAAWLYNCDVG